MFDKYDLSEDENSDKLCHNGDNPTFCFRCVDFSDNKHIPENIFP